MPTLVEVRFKGNRRDYFTWDQEPDLAPGQTVIVTVDRGQDLGTVSAVGTAAERKCAVGCSGCASGQTPAPSGPVVRVASTEEAHLAGELRKAEEDVRRTVMQRAGVHRLVMKVSDAEWQWDRKKLTVYFTAEQRVDFRALVRDLAGLFRTRIELRQIGARDEAKRLEGVGRCGREYCCSSWLPELRPVSLALAKDQHLSLNPSQISGGCGRLLCCLRYEHEFYVGSRKRFPKEGKIVVTAQGEERVQAVDIFRERVLLRSPDGTTRTVTLAELRDEFAQAPPQAPPDAPPPPTQLMTFDEGSIEVTPERALEAVAPEARSTKRRRRRGRRGGRGRNPVERPEQSGGSEPDGSDGSGGSDGSDGSDGTTGTMGKFYITTAIDYANGEPHLGHAFEKIGADCIARYRRLRGERVHFVIGMDEHGQKVAQAAEEAGVSPQEWVDDIAQRFRDAWRELRISHDDFIRTTEPRHARAVQELFRRIQERGHIFEGVYAGYYCVGCEAFKLDKDLDAEGRCPTHPTRQVRWVEEPNFFFRLSTFAPWLLERYAANPEFVRPRAKMNEIRNVVTDGLQDISVSRARVPWGIPWPGDDTHTVYVWFEALINYLSATGYPDAGYEALWPADLHVIGPDIVRFHAAMWPAMLEAAGLEPPRGVWSHGWVNTQGQRFSKSAGVRVSLREIIDRHGPDPLRYFLLREVPWDGDGSFSFERFDIRYTADLADGYGNLVSRVLAMVTRYLGGAVPARTSTTALDESRDAVWQRYADAMDRHLLHEGAAAALTLVADANGFIEARAPWSLAKEPASRLELEQVLAALTDTVQAVTVMLAPFMPDKTAEVWRALGNASPEVTPITNGVPRTSGQRVTKVTPLFPKPPAAS